ncbi:MAG: tRNA (N6-isopentenyl adenosine(37)-C2)-methylthiotransferase MiaB [Deltaproteobacteria bacterium]|nr:MAG: tRNA (N6-isopentenyl adenosine(37)-C2)-methylthiotransferase MiaB [Deltaproteobacteria bacterium]RTZ99678.1 MAG: tRNA (N6-isopentenyl adenosine(37)-C2)-methylthiotransferase MiaB [Deltaproteobacteria bacterium]
MTKKNLFIQTIGCQMNVYDSRQIENMMRQAGYQRAGSADKADLIIVNTCAIRDKAEQKLYSLLGRLAPIKQRNPDVVLAVGGCVAQQEGKALLSRVPYLDLVFGTHTLNRIPELVARVISTKSRIVDVGIHVIEDPLPTENARGNGKEVSRFVTIMRGCDNFCTYCVVPYVRGRETSRAPDRIIAEIEALVGEGIREVTLLGQNVNSYGNREGLITFPELLLKVNEISGLSRIRFTTSHPKDLSDALIESFVSLEKLCPHIHLPVQSGSDAVLKRMKRRYTRDMFSERVAGLREKCGDIALTSDIIVGFPGETESDFQLTLDLIQEIQFDGLFAFKYSDRPNARAAGYMAKVSEKEKARRLQVLLDCQQAITLKKNRALEGTEQVVLVEGVSRMSDTRDPQWTGRSLNNKIVNFTIPEKIAPSEEDWVGRQVKVVIYKGLLHSLQGKMLA